MTEGVHWTQTRPYFKDVIETYNDRSITEIEIRTAALNCLPVHSVAEVFVGLSTDTTLYLSRREEALKVDRLTFIIRTSDSSWHPGLPGRPLFLE